MRNFILLIAGIVITVLFFIFGDSLYEALYYEAEFSNEMYNEGVYTVVSTVDVLMAWGVAALYYYVINSVSFSRWYHWLIALAVASVGSSLIIYLYGNNVFTELNYDFDSQLFLFSLINTLIVAVLFIVSSFSMRWWSSNCRHTPIPE